MTPTATPGIWSRPIRRRTRAAKSSESPVAALAWWAGAVRLITARTAGGSRVAASCHGALGHSLGDSLGDSLRNQEEADRQENHHTREKDEPHEKANAQVQSERRDGPHLARAAWPDEEHVADLHQQRAPACEHGDPGRPRQPAEIVSAEDGLRDGLPDRLAVPPLPAHCLVQTGGEIDHAKVELHHPETTDRNRLLSAGRGRRRRERPGAPGGRDQEVEEERIGQLIHT